MSYQTWKSRVLAPGAKGIDIDGTGDFDCVDVVKDYDRDVHGNKPWSETGIHGNGKDIFDNANPKYWQKIVNDHDNPNQLPLPGDIMCFNSTPAKGYANTFDNPYGHTGVCDRADSNGYTLAQQASSSGRAPWLDTRPWKFRPCKGWLHPLLVSTPAPVMHIETIKPGTWNVRETPNINSDARGIAIGGQKYDTTVLEGGWRKVSFRGKAGYIGPKAF